MDIEPWLLLTHIGAAMLWVGGGAALAIVGWRAGRSGDMVVIGHFARLLSFIGLRLFAPAVALVLLSGIWLVLQQSRAFTDLWVLLALVALGAAFLVGAVYLSRMALRLERTTSEADADPTAAQATLRGWVTGYAVVLAILAFAVWDMIFKPGA
jgi:uncharacterized membrane protein